MPCQTVEEACTRLIGLAAAVLLVCCAAGYTACRAPDPPERAAAVATKPDIILITVDALRADHLGVYGYDRPTSPSLDAFAKDAVVVRTHVTQAPYTKAAMASLFTGLLPTAHKAFSTSRTFGEAMSGKIAGTLPMTDVLDARLDTLAERLAAQGYETCGLNTNPFLLAEFGFGQGFARYEFLAREGNFSNARDVTARGLELIEARDRSRPLFLWLHLREPHSPYTPAPAARALFPRVSHRSSFRPRRFRRGRPPTAHWTRVTTKRSTTATSAKRMTRSGSSSMRCGSVRSGSGGSSP